MPFELLILLGLILLNGLFALSEMAIITARKSRLRQMASSSRGARTALLLAEEPERFLSTVQVGITLVGILTGMLGGRELGLMITSALTRIGWQGPMVDDVGIVLSVMLITFTTIVLGELVPKRVGMASSEHLAARLALPLAALARISYPVVALLSVTTNAVLWLLGVKPQSSSAITEEEIRLLVAESAEQGLIEPVERGMVNRVLRLGDRPVEALMTPRRKIAWLDFDADLCDNLETMQATPFSRFPVKRGSDKEIVGILEVKSLVARLHLSNQLELFATMIEPLYVPEGTPALNLVNRFRDSNAQMALVVDEYGDILGMLTADDLLSAVLGQIAPAPESKDSPLIRRPDGSLSVAGSLPIEELHDLLHLDDWEEERGDFHTVSGMVMSQFGHLPRVGEILEWGGLRFEVMALDGAQISRLLVARVERQVDDDEEADLD